MKLQQPEQLHGPVSEVSMTLKMTKWSWPAPFMTQNTQGCAMSFLEMPTETWKHEVREGIRQ
eukprot:12429036-Karenia_brevis.AAC.1